MKKTELAMLTTKGDIQRLIDEKFSEWDSIHESGSDGTSYMPDGYLLNNLRHDIIQLRVRKARLFDSEVVGQLTFDGGECRTVNVRRWGSAGRAKYPRPSSHELVGR